MPRHPNVIFCICDELRAFEVGCYGHPVVRTPNIDRLADRGVRFETACSNNPVCTPARSILLTGQYSRTCNGQTGNVIDPQGPRRHLAGTTLAEAYRSAGYHTASIGKWHMQPSPGDVGFDRFVYPTFWHKYSGRTYFDHSSKPFEIDGWTWDFDTNLVRSYLANRAGADKPFFLYYNIEPPHMPLLDAPDHYTRMYDPRDVVLRPNTMVDGTLAHDETAIKGYRWDYQFYRDRKPGTTELPEGFGIRQLTALYYGLITLVDDQVGKLVAELSRLGMLDDTLLVFTSDHGDNFGSHGAWAKSMLYEESIRVPLIFHWPSRLAPRKNNAQVAGLIDLAPTMLGLTGVTIPPSVQGTDLTPLVRGERDTIGANAAFIETFRDGIGIRTPHHLYGFKLADTSGYEHKPEYDQIVDDQHRFYDLHSDPFEMNNLGPASGDDPVAGELRQRLLGWHRQTPWLPPLDHHIEAKNSMSENGEHGSRRRSTLLQ